MAGMHAEDPGPLRADAVRYLSFAVRRQRLGRIAAAVAGGLAASRGGLGGEPGGPGVGRPDRGLLFVQHDERRLHVLAQRTGVCRFGAAGHGLSVANAAPPEHDSQDHHAKTARDPGKRAAGTCLRSKFSGRAAAPAGGREALPGGLGGTGPLPPTPPTVSPAEAIIIEREEEPSALDALEGHVLGRHVKTVFCCWTVIFSVVGAQMAWVLRPYFGNADPNVPFVWFGPRTSNFFEGVWTALHQLFR